MYIKKTISIREGKDIHIVPYNDQYHTASKALNEQWISTYFKIEEADTKVLNNPKSYILDKGGKIFVALYKGQPVGVCTLIKMNDPDYDYEMAKMAVSPDMQGKSNTLLKPAISLYHKLGFKKVVGRSTPYARCNIQMELLLDN